MNDLLICLPIKYLTKIFLKKQVMRVLSTGPWTSGKNPLIFWIMYIWCSTECDLRCIHSENTSHLPIIEVSYLCSIKIYAWENWTSFSQLLSRTRVMISLWRWTKYLGKCNTRITLCTFHFYNNFKFCKTNFFQFVAWKISIRELHWYNIYRPKN